MTVLTLTHITKRYGNVTAVDDFNLTVADGEFVTLLGPSGCGKTSTLRMMAGLIRPTYGEIKLGERILNAVGRGVFVPPEQRNMGMVFQSYAVWPHKNTFENVAYPLRLRRTPKQTIQVKVNEALAMVNLEGMGTRYPHQLSGGQQQRVALARALIMEPDVLLLDEPLSNLDAQLREHMRAEITALHGRMSMTVVYVTHDQDEAMAMSDRIVVMNEGRIQQVGTPEAVYLRPDNAFVAQFVGTANLLPVHISAEDGSTVTVTLPGGAALRVAKPEHLAESARLLVRPESFAMHTNGEGHLTGEVTGRVFLGEKVDYRVRAGAYDLRVYATREPAFRVGDVVSLTITDCFLML